MMHAQGKGIDENTEFLLGTNGFKPVKSVKLLGVTLDRYLTFGAHIGTVIAKANGLLGMLARSARILPTQLLRATYISLIRSHLEYCSAVWASAAPTHLRKIDIIQKRASRVILHAPRDAHSEPLQKALKLDTLENRRHSHIIKIVQHCITDSYNPALNELFTASASNDGNIILQRQEQDTYWQASKALLATYMISK